MTDIVLESIRAIFSSVIFVYLFIVGRRERIQEHQGWLFIVTGFALISFGTIIDITDNFDTLNRFVLIGDTKYQAFLEKVIGFLLGFILLAFGFWKWIPAIVSIEKAQKDLRETQESLECRVEERTEQLRKEVVEHKKTADILRYAEREWDHTFNAMTDFVSVHDLDHRIVKVNRALADFLGKSQVELIGRHCYEVMHGMDEAWPDCPHSKALELQTPITEEVDDPHIGCPLLVTASPIYDEHGDLKGTVHIARNIKKIKEAEKEQQKLLAQLQQAQKIEAIGTLAGGIAHDFNNILAAIIGYTDLIKLKLPKTDPTQSELEEISKASNRATDLVKQILTFSRQADHERKPLQIQEITKEALNLLRPSIPSTIEIRQHIDQKCGAVLADPSQVHQILMNLCTNAAQAMEEKGGVLDISVENKELSANDVAGKPDLTAGRFVRLTVSDTGHGMDKGRIDRIFEPFYTTKKIGEGTGLGLSVVLGIVQRHGAMITVDSQLGKGTTFDAFFPEIEMGVSQELDNITSLPTGNNERVLVVEDEETIARITKEILLELGYRVVTRTSSVEALNDFITQAQEFDLVITDQTMPNMTGFELAGELLKIRPDLPVILCTGYSKVISEEKAKSIGIREYLMKPVAMATLARTVRKVLDEN